MTVVRYNQIYLPYPDTVNFRQSAMYDQGAEGSGTDWFCTQFDISVQTKINFNYLAMIAPDLIVAGKPVTDNAAQIMSVIRSRLLKPRRDFSITANGVELIPQPAAGNAGLVDAQNGPKPQSCTITQLTTNLFLVTYHIIAHYWERNEVTPSGSPIIRNLPGNNVLYNRWTESQFISETNFSKRIRVGKFVIRSDNFDGIIADQMRVQMAVVGIPKKFVRESSEYTVSLDGLALSYKIVDRQVFKLPPPPAYKASGTYAETGTYNGAVRHGEVHLRLEGSPDTDQDVLADLAMSIATQKVRKRGAKTDEKGNLSLIDNAAVRVGMYDNWVEVCLRVMLNQGDSGRGDGIAGFGWDLFKGALINSNGTPKLCETPESDDVEDSPEYKARGSNCSLLLQAAAYYDPSIPGTILDDKTGQLDTGLAPGQAGQRAEA